ncbi:VanZ family protein [Streptomyces sp. NPDC060194]|uniref:VanZ family protein n=1 Tax=Streptomyces sp. NPDC060194 TaxID=3347069 RepID=UPI00364F946C
MTADAETAGRERTVRWPRRGRADGAAAPRPPADDGRPTWGAVLLRAAVVAVAFVGLVAFSAVLARLTLTPSAASEDLIHTNLQPGDSLRNYFEDYTVAAALKQVGGNILLGVPFGVLLPLLVPGRMRMVRVVAVTVLVMVLVELAQGSIIQGRAFDIDDVIMNTTGALLGYLLLGRRLARRMHPDPDRPRTRRPARRSRFAKSA